MQVGKVKRKTEDVYLWKQERLLGRWPISNRSFRTYIERSVNRSDEAPILEIHSLDVYMHNHKSYVSIA